LQIIGFGGVAKAGKSTAADELAKWCVENGCTPKIMSFAGALKRAAATIGAEKGGPFDALYRRFCQDVGTDMRDPKYAPGITGPDYWVNLMQRLIRAVAQEEIDSMSIDMSAGDNRSRFHERVIIIDDVRFMNEIDLIRRHDGWLVFIDAGRRLTDLDAAWRKHDSEKLAFQYMNGVLPDETFDVSISSNNSEADLRAVIRRMAPLWLNQVAGP